MDTIGLPFFPPAIRDRKPYAASLLARDMARFATIWALKSGSVSRPVSLKPRQPAALTSGFHGKGVD